MHNASVPERLWTELGSPLKHGNRLIGCTSFAIVSTIS